MTQPEDVPGHRGPCFRGHCRPSIGAPEQLSTEWTVGEGGDGRCSGSGQWAAWLIPAKATAPLCPTGKSPGPPGGFTGPRHPEALTTGWAPLGEPQGLHGARPVVKSFSRTLALLGGLAESRVVTPEGHPAAAHGHVFPRPAARCPGPPRAA